MTASQGYSVRFIFGNVIQLSSIEISDDDKRAAYIRKNILGEMSSARQALLKLVLRLLVRTAKQSEVNKMKIPNLAVIWAPNLIRCSRVEDEMKLLGKSQKIVQIMIELCDDIFGEEPSNGDSDKGQSSSSEEGSD